MSFIIKSYIKEEKPPVWSLKEKQADKVFALYRRFLDEAPCQDCSWMTEDFLSVETCPHPWQDLDIGVDDVTMEKVLRATGVLPLRQVVKDSRILVVGCGNSPISDDKGYPLAAKHCQEDRSESYRECHEHIGAITINPYLAANPTLVGFFGAQKFPMLADGQFDLIAIEGTLVDDTIVGRLELKRLLSPHGKVVYTDGLPDMKGYEFTWETQKSATLSKPVAISDITIYPSFRQGGFRL